MSEWKNILMGEEEMDQPGEKEITESRPGEKEITESRPGEEQPARRRRRADRYTEEPETEKTAPPKEERPAAKQPQDSPSETAREVANRYRRQQAAPSVPMGGTMRIPAQSSRAGMAQAARKNPEQVGYASGRMGMNSMQRARMSEEGRARLAEESQTRGDGRLRSADAGFYGEENDPRRNGSGQYAGENGRYPGRDGNGVYGGRPVIANREKEAPAKRPGAALTAIIVALIVIGALIVAMMAMPEDSFLGGLRRQIGGTTEVMPAEIRRAVLTFEVSGQSSKEAPATVDFTIVTERGVEDVRLLSETGDPLPFDQEKVEQEERILWELSWDAEEPYSGKVRLQTLAAEEWAEVEITAQVRILEPGEEPERTEETELPAAIATETPTETPLMTITPEPTDEAPEDGEFGDGEKEGAGENGTAEAWDPDDPENAAAGADPDDPDQASGTAESGAAGNMAAEADPDDPERADALGNTADESDPEESGIRGDADDSGEDAEGEMTAAAEEENAEDAAADARMDEDSAATASADTADDGLGTAAVGAGAEEQARPIMTVSASEDADPSLIPTRVIYNGTKKVTEYARSDKEKIHMPTLGEYTKVKMGVLTWRSDAFRQNAAIGTAKGLNSLEVAWTAEAGSVKGSGQTYYGIGWTGQPAIVKWSKNVREQSEMYDAKKEKTGLKEVIIGGLDGRIYFLDLADGTATRNSIKLGFPMKGSASVHPGGAPYMTIGQFARKMANTTGTIGLRQYNLYRMKELSLIDGLDAKNNRPYNKVGSFETSALIDRKTNTMITAGTNGLLYVINLNPEFDYNAGTYTQSPTQVVMKSKAKGESDAYTAVEASIAMYDRYVYYADMGGYLRCVDTNSMTIAWAVALGDAVESTPALDWHGEDGLDLYTATELANRKKGDAEITCFDALTGEARWTAAFGVKKDTKNKSVSGFRASPVVGQNGLSEYVYYTINNLSAEGQAQLDIGDETAAIIALRKEDGSVAWAKGLTGRGYSSPVAVYDDKGNGVIIQCAGDGSIVMLDGETGEKRASLEIDGAIEASPAVYDGMMVIGTTEKNKNNIYGIRVK